MGRVTLDGAGPGDPGLLTQRGREALMVADDVVYDALVSERILALCNSRRHIVGKRAGVQAVPQADIEALLVRLALSGRNVCRLKGGDPFLFGRGGEEVEALERAGIEHEVIPGVTAALGAAAYCGVPLTHRERSSSVAFCTGHAEPVPVPAVDTIVYYMAAASLARVAAAVLSAGWPAATPVLIVRNATLPNQESVLTSLERVRSEGVVTTSPSLVIVGGASELKLEASKLGWYSGRSKVLITGTRTEPFAHLGEAIHTPLLETAPAENQIVVRQAIDRLAEFDHLVFTSSHAVEYFLRQLGISGLDTRALAGRMIAAVGKTTAKALAYRGLATDMIGFGNGAQGLLAAYTAAKISGVRILLPASDLARETLAEGLRAAGNRVDVVTFYQTVTRPDLVPEDLTGISFVAFSSPSGVTAFQKLYGSRLPAHLRIVALGELTSRAAGDAYPRHELDMVNA